MNKGKFLRLKKDKKIYFRTYVDNYYCFLKKKKKEGFSQVIIPSNCLLKILNDRFIEFNSFKIKKIEFETEDEELKREIEKNITSVNDNSRLIVKLNDFLNEIIYGESIEIKAINYSYRNQEKKLIDIILYNTGYMEFSGPSKDIKNEIKILIKIITKFKGE